jgi:hypothetical protein
LEVKIAATCKYDSDVQGVQKVAVHWAAVYCDCPRMLNELKTAITAYIRNISQADLQKLLAKKIKRVQALWTSLPTPSISAQRLSELPVYHYSNCVPSTLFPRSRVTRYKVFSCKKLQNFLSPAKTSISIVLKC